MTFYGNNDNCQYYVLERYKAINYANNSYL